MTILDDHFDCASYHSQVSSGSCSSMEDDPIESFPPSPSPQPGRTEDDAKPESISSSPPKPLIDTETDTAILDQVTQAAILTASASPAEAPISSASPPLTHVTASPTLAPAPKTSTPLGVRNPPISKARGWESGGFGAYMSEKERKLREQFASEVDPAQATSVFAGVTVWVTGATKPPRTEIRRLLAENGGKFETYLSRERVTHVVADNLATATRRRMATTPGKPSPYKIVTAQWVVDSARAGARKSEAEYPVGGMGDPGQKRVTAMFRRGGGRK